MSNFRVQRSEFGNLVIKGHGYSASFVESIVAYTSTAGRSRRSTLALLDGILGTDYPKSSMPE